MMIEKELPAISLNNTYESDEFGDERKAYNNVEFDNIEKLRKEIKTDINSMQTKIEKILNKRETNYLSTFDEFMDTVRKDLKQKIEQMEKVEKEKRKNNDIKIVTSERDFFRQEAIRLNQLCKDLSLKNDEMARELKFQTNELTNISRKWKDSENTNKQLIVELERNIQINKDLEFHLKMSQENPNFDTIRNMNQSPINEVNFEEDNFDIFNKDKLIRIIEKIKIDLKKERSRNHKILAELNKVILDQNKLEKIFIDCVEECRKDIFNRKFKESFSNSKADTMSKFVNMPYLNDTKYDNFLPFDKRKLLEIFIMKEEVISLVKDHVFKKIDGASIYDNKNGNELTQRKSSFMKTEKMYSMQSFRKKTPSTGFTYTMQIRAKTPIINNL